MIFLPPEVALSESVTGEKPHFLSEIGNFDVHPDFWTNPNGDSTNQNRIYKIKILDCRFWIEGNFTESHGLSSQM